MVCMYMGANYEGQALNRAYEVLSDAKQRAIYDSLGEEGLKTSWEVGTKYQTPEQVRQHHMCAGEVGADGGATDACGV